MLTDCDISGNVAAGGAGGEAISQVLAEMAAWRTREAW